jgi:hypothetical protein
MSNDHSDRTGYLRSYRPTMVKPQWSPLNYDYHDSMRTVDKRMRDRDDISDQIFMEGYPLEPRRVRLVDERSISTGVGSRFVDK